MKTTIPKLHRLPKNIPKENLVQVGLVAYRDENGFFTNAQPIYQEKTPFIEQQQQEQEEIAITLFSDMLTDFIQKQETI